MAFSYSFRRINPFFRFILVARLLFKERKASYINSIPAFVWSSKQSQMRLTIQILAIFIFPKAKQKSIRSPFNLNNDQAASSRRHPICLFNAFCVQGKTETQAPNSAGANHFFQRCRRQLVTPNGSNGLCLLR